MRYNTPTGNSVIDPTNDDAMKSTTNHWLKGYGKYGVKAIWMDVNILILFYNVNF